ncbi:MAG: two-component regulator propeller domain-containing protein, partial [Acidobacteriota bacterium]
EDINGNLWFSTEGFEFIRFKDRIFTSELTLPGFKFLDVDNDFGLWALSAKEILRFDIRDLSKKLAFPISENPSQSMIPLFSAGSSKFLLNKDKGLLFFEAEKFNHFNLPPELLDSTLFIHKISQNRYWLVNLKGVGILENGVYRPIYQIDFSKYHENPTSFIATISKSDGSLWINYREFLYQINENNFKFFQTDKDAKPSPNTFMVDREGNIWFGTIGNGLIRFMKKQIRLFSLVEETHWKSVSPILQAQDGTIWVGSTHGLAKINGDETKVYDKLNGIPISVVNSLTIDNKGSLWFGMANGIWKFQNGEFTNERTYKDSVVPDYSINSLFFDKNDALWIGYRNRGVEIFKDGKASFYTTDNGLIGNEIHNIFQDSKGIVWVGTSQGLSRFQDGVITNFTVENGLSNNYIRDIYEDSEGILWLGTYGGGIIRYSNGIFKAITTKQGLFEDIASRILYDDAGKFWILGNRSIYSVKKDDLNQVADGLINSVNCIFFGKTDGMRVSEGNGGNQPAGWKMTNGELWFPMIKGGVIITPNPLNKLAPPVYIENILLQEKSL